jgi:segregation and condensation protein B
MEDRKKIEAVLFAIGDKIEAEEVSRLTKLDINIVNSELHKLKEDYAQSGSTFILLNEGTKWKLTVREDYMPIVQKIVPKTELPRPVLETLAVIAWKSPVLQSDIISIRSSKAYDHISELESVGFITKQKYGRSFMLRLSQQFFEYFDIQGKEQIKDVFKDVKGVGNINNQDKTLADFAAVGKNEAEMPNPPGTKAELPMVLPQTALTAPTPPTLDAGEASQPKGEAPTADTNKEAPAPKKPAKTSKRPADAKAANPN